MPTCLKRLSIPCLLIKHCNSSRVCVHVYVYVAERVYFQTDECRHHFTGTGDAQIFKPIRFVLRSICLHACVVWIRTDTLEMVDIFLFFFHFIRWFVRLR